MGACNTGASFPDPTIVARYARAYFEIAVPINSICLLDIAVLEGETLQEFNNSDFGKSPDQQHLQGLNSGAAHDGSVTDKPDFLQGGNIREPMHPLRVILKEYGPIAVHDLEMMSQSKPRAKFAKQLTTTVRTVNDTGANSQM